MTEDLLLTVLCLFDGTFVLNIVAIGLLALIAVRSKNMPFILTFFVYTVFHHADTVPSILLGDRERMNYLHLVSSVEVIISGVVFLLVWLLFVFRDVRDNLIDFTLFIKVYFSFMGVLSCALFLNAFFTEPDSLRSIIKDSVSLISTLFIAYVFSIIIRYISRPWNLFELRFVVFVSALVLSVAVYEVMNELAWAANMISGGMLYRASSTMFNPNVLGLWGGLLVFFGGYLLEQRPSQTWCGYGLCVIGIIVIFLSGSRSSFLFCGMMLFLVSCLRLFIGSEFKKCFHYLATFTLGFFLVCMAGEYINLISSTFLPLQLLAERFLSLPQLLYTLITGGSLDQSSQVVIDGRIGKWWDGSGSVGAYDNGYISMISNSLWVFLIWILMIVFLMVSGVKKFLDHKNDSAVYALTTLVGFIMIGMFIRAYQVFPVWGLSSLMLGIFIAWITTNEKIKS